MAKEIEPNKILTATVTEATFNTPESSNGFQLFWELVENDTAKEQPTAPSTIEFSIVLPKGTEIPLEIGAVDVTTNFIASTEGFGGVKLKAVVIGISGDEQIHLYCKGLF